MCRKLSESKATNQRNMTVSLGRAILEARTKRRPRSGLHASTLLELRELHLAKVAAGTTREHVCSIRV